MNYFLTRLSICFLLFFYTTAKAITLREEQSEYKVSEYPHFLWIDSSGVGTLQDYLEVSKGMSSSLRLPHQFQVNQRALWLGLDLCDSSHSDAVSWLMEFYNYRIEKIDLYLVETSNGNIVKEYHGGDLMPFDRRENIHKNFIFNLPLAKGKAYRVCIRTQASHPFTLECLVRSHPRLLQYATNEYWALGLFYGVLIAISLLTLFVYIFLREKIYFYYLLSIASFTLYFLAQDGLAFEYLWPTQPAFNGFVFAYALCLFILFKICFTKTFFNISWRSTQGKLLMALGLLRLLYLIAGLLFSSSLHYVLAIDLIPIGFLMYLSLLQIRQGFRPARYYFIGSTALFLGLLIFVLMEWGWIPANLFTVYAINVGALLEAMVFFLSLAYRFRFIMHEKNLIEQSSLLQKREMEWMEQNRKWLEENLKHRNKELDRKNKVIREKNKVLDTFIYKSSHDLRGPLKTLIGLSKLGERENVPEQSEKYFQMIRMTAEGLDDELASLSSISELNSLTSIPSVLDLNDFFRYVTEMEEYENIEVNYLSEADRQVHSDERILTYAFTHLMQAAYKMRLGSDLSGMPIRYGLQKSKTHLLLHASVPIGGNARYFSQHVFDPFNKDLKSIYKIKFEFFIIREAMEKMGGKVSVTFSKDERIEIRLEWPESPMEE